MASLRKNRRTTLERIEKFISPTYFADVNLYGRLYTESKNIDVYHWPLPANQSWKFTKFHDVVNQSFTLVSPGQSFGPTWTTHWFKIVAKVPQIWSGKQVHLRWNSSSEAQLYDSSGATLQGFTGSPDFQKREEYIISKSWNSEFQDELVFYIEMACNDMFGAGKNGLISPPDPAKEFKLQKADIAVFDENVYQLIVDLELLHEMANELTEELGKGHSRGYKALYCANEMINLIQSGDFKTPQQLSNNFFNQKNGEGVHLIDAMGHCHIDTAWLWPFDETIRKCARSWSSVVNLLQEFPDFTFTCSQAQQFSWVKEYYPLLYSQIKEFVLKGRFIPVGGTWIEMDGNIPSGESFLRQFLYGQRYFMKEFGAYCKEFWLPDTFGYSAQIPQIMKHVGISRFLTQKLSWSLVNKFPHHNFWWEGIDGSAVLVHFPPGDSYEAKCKVSEALKTERNLQDKGRVSRSVMLYGYGDGGGGPHRSMLYRLNRLKDVDGIPKLQHSTPTKFFSNLEKESSNLCRWVGELYLELHNGTYTSQADMKKWNRHCEFQLRDAELLLSVALALERISDIEFQQMQEATNEAWRLLLVNQFHDVLPGSSIEMVHVEARQFFLQCEQVTKDVIRTCMEILFGKSGNKTSFLNSLPWPRTILRYENSIPKEVVKIEGFGCSISSNGIPAEMLTISETDTTIEVSNQYFKVVFDRSGRIVSMMHTLTGNEVIHPDGSFGNQLVLFDDIPLFWDAWDCMDYHLETRKIVNDLDVNDPLHVEMSTPLKVILKWGHSVGNSSQIVQRIHISVIDPYVEFENNVSWKENRKFLKVEFPLNVHTTQAAFDIQFGHVTRPTHMNTSWDWAKFEVCGHKWADLSELNWGVAILNDSKYGWNAQGHKLTLSLLRSPKSPDEYCDMQDHYFKYALLPHEGVSSKLNVIQAAYNFNCQPIAINVDPSDKRIVGPWFECDSSAVILETVKPCEPPLCNENGKSPTKVVIRLYESCGSRTLVRIATRLPFKSVQECNGLEEAIAPVNQLAVDHDIRWFSSSFTPFQIRSFLLSL